MILKIDTERLDKILKRGCGNRLTHTYSISVTDKERAQMGKMAKLCGVSLSKYIRLLHACLIDAYEAKK